MASQEELDRSTLLRLFPPNIWTQILQLVELGYYNTVAGSSPFLKSCLEPLKTQILFLGVAEILSRRFLLKTTDILTTRCVCRAWKKAVDYGLNNGKFYPRQSKDWFDHLPFHMDVVLHRNVFEDSLKLVRFTEQFDNPRYNGNPFITPNVSITIDDNIDALSTFCEALFPFLHKFGHHINYCLLCLRINDSAQLVNFFTQLGTILKLMPNLRQLQLQVLGGLRLDSPLELKLERAVKEHPIPKMSHLKHLKQIRLTAAVIREIVQKNQQISVVESQFHDDEHLKIYLEEMPNLKALEVFIYFWEEFAAFRDSRVNCQLTKLIIEMFDFETKWVNVFAMLNHHFSNTLEELCIRLPHHKNLGKSLNTDDVLILPKLKKLWISFEKPTSLDFILPMENHLEELSISVDDFYPTDERSKPDGVIDIFDVGDSIYESNIWTLFPKLDKLCVRLKFSRFEGDRKSWTKWTKNDSKKNCMSWDNCECFGMSKNILICMIMFVVCLIVVQWLYSNVNVTLFQL